MERPSKEQFWGYFILAARLLLAWPLIGYGRSKLIDGQFGVTEETMNMALASLKASNWNLHLLSDPTQLKLGEFCEWDLLID